MDCSKFFSSADLVFGIGSQTAPGVVAPTIHYLDVTNISKSNAVETEEIRGNVGVLDNLVEVEQKNRTGSVQVEGYMKKESWGLFLKAFFGTATPTLDAPEIGVNTHNFTVLSEGCGALSTLHLLNNKATADNVEQYLDGVCSKLEVAAAKDGTLKIVADFITKYPTRETVVAAPILTESNYKRTHGLLYIEDTVADLAGATAVCPESVKIIFEKENTDFGCFNELDKNYFVTGFKSSIELINLKEYDDTTFEDLLLSGDTKAVKLDFIDTDETIGATTNPSASLEFAAIAVTVNTEDLAQAEITKQNITGVALRSTAEGFSFRGAIVNTVAAY